MDLNFKIFSDITDLSRTRHKLNRCISTDDLVDSESYKNLNSTDSNLTLPSVSSRSEKAATNNIEPSKVGAGQAASSNRRQSYHN